uniref:protein NODULATION SIGNALING PATHWAY 2-like n=1 Tax=Erigeron canadensis TaxID=72917 RepID=UPI001CB8F26A|nr:protein NODULATION SIGNALING PATHWAY 2-like [Erigeron canadensis]
MMQSEVQIQPSWPIHTYFNTNLDHYASHHHEFPSSINSTPENSFISSESYGYVEYPLLGYDQMQQSSSDTNDSQNMMVLENMNRWLCDEDQDIEEIQLSDISGCVPSEEMSPMEEVSDTMELESQTGLQSLLKAYAEAMEMGQTELAQVIVSCISEKIYPIGPAIERIAFNLFQSAENQEEYLKRESVRNFKSAFRAFYEIFPYGRFAHFTANSAICEAVPTHVKSVDIIDFDLLEGSQWPVVIEAIAQQRKSLTITSVKLEDHNSQFEHIKRDLCSFARTFGLNLKIQDVDMAQIVNKMEGKEFVVFNCMVGLPHMGRTRETSQVMDFLKIARAVLAKNKGIITVGDGAGGRLATSSNYTSFFNENLAHYKALYESMECGFPSYLNEARTAMETLFVAPFISSESWFQKWEEGRENTTSIKGLGLKGRTMSINSLNEARELVKEGESPYGIRIEGQNGNEMVLKWNATPLVKVSVWECN